MQMLPVCTRGWVVVSCSQGMPGGLYFSRHACKQEKKKAANSALIQLIIYIHTVIC